MVELELLVPNQRMHGSGTEPHTNSKHFGIDAVSLNKRQEKFPTDK
jgi:hypothetical protein